MKFIVFGFDAHVGNCAVVVNSDKQARGIFREMLGCEVDGLSEAEVNEFTQTGVWTGGGLSSLLLVSVDDNEVDGAIMVRDCNDVVFLNEAGDEVSPT